MQKKVLIIESLFLGIVRDSFESMEQTREDLPGMKPLTLTGNPWYGCGFFSHPGGPGATYKSFIER
jgi:hypothetical protein